MALAMHSLARVPRVSVIGVYLPVVIGSVVLGISPMGGRADPAVDVRPLFTDPLKLARWLAGRDPQVAAARARAEAAIAASHQAGVHPNPQLSASLGGLVVGATNPSAPRLGLDQTTNVTAGVSQLFELGKRGPRQQAARLRADEAAVQATATLGARVGEAMATLGKLAYVTSRRAAVAANLETARALLALEKVRHDHADLSGAEFSRIELDTQAIELQLGRADADVATAAAVCSAVLHAPCSTDGIAEPTALDAAAPLPEPVPDDDAIAHRSAREVSRLEIAALGADALLARRRAVPDPTIGVSYTYDNLVVAGNQQQTVMLSLSLPLPIFDRGDHDATALAATARADAADDRAVVDIARGEVVALRAQRATLATTLTRLEGEAVPKSALIVQQTRRSFDLGQAGLADLLLAERAHRELLLEVLDTRFDLFNVRAQLRQALGLDDQAARTAEASS
jgi:cobalt-zinc-cadmium efflux system outer membrane protein